MFKARRQNNLSLCTEWIFYLGHYISVASFLLYTTQTFILSVLERHTYNLELVFHLIHLNFLLPSCSTRNCSYYNVIIAK